MDTPQRGQARAVSTNFPSEDSPVFSYISSLSPIKPFKSVHVTQALHSVSFSSPSLVFASPLSSTHKESKLPSSCRSFNSSLDATTNLLKISACNSEGIHDYESNYVLDKAPVGSSEIIQTLRSSLPSSLDYDCGSPDHNTDPCFSSTVDIDRIKVNLADFTEEIVASSVEPVQHAILQGSGQNKEDGPESCWVNLTADAGVNIIGSGASTECFEKVKDEVDCFSMWQDKVSGTALVVCPQETSTSMVGDCGQEHVSKQDDSDHSLEVPSASQANPITYDQFENSDEGDADQGVSGIEGECQHQRGFRRRCLVFDKPGGPGLHMDSDLVNDPLASFPSNLMDLTEESAQSSPKLSCDSNLHLLPSIGLHLNSVAMSLKVSSECDDSLSSGRKLLSLPCSSGPISSLVAVRSANTDVIKKEHDSVSENQDFQTIPGEDVGPASPKKKRGKLDVNAESGSCRRCNCKKSKCLKLYCECFAAGVYCLGPCTCEGCMNIPIHANLIVATRKQIETRNPLAFAPKVVRETIAAPAMGEEISKTPSSARHKRGCNCKKSGCLKKYCECYQGGVGCTASCRCDGCKNTFGRKEDQSEEKIDPCSVNGVDFPPKPISPSLPLGSSQCSSSIGSEPSPLLSSCRRTETHMVVSEIIRQVKTTSPNGKRVVGPKHEAGLGKSPSKKGGRRLILRSVPAFPALPNIPYQAEPINSLPQDMC